MKQDPENKSKQVPYLEDRHTLGHWAGKQVSQGTMNEYRSKMNNSSLDGLPGLRVARKDSGEHQLWYRDIQSQIRRRNNVQYALVAIISCLLTVVSLYILGLTVFPTPDLIMYTRS